MKESAPFKYPSLLVMDVLRLIGFTISKAVWFIRYEGRTNIPPNDSPPFIVVANHQTYIDPVWACLPMRRRIRYMAFAPAFEWKFVGSLIRYIGAFPIPHDSRSTIRAMKESIRSLRNGAILTIFPEGAREFSDGEILEFKTGAIRIARQADVPVLPVTIRGGNRIWPQKQKYPRLFRRVTVTYHPLMEIVEDETLSLRENDEIWTAKLRDLVDPNTNRP